MVVVVLPVGNDLTDIRQVFKPVLVLTATPKVAIE